MSNDNPSFATSEHPEFSQVYPERKGELIQEEGDSFFAKRLNKKRENLVKRCQYNSLKCFENVPYLKLLWNSIEKQGCKLDLGRHFSCELCQPGSDIQHSGTFDESTNQVVICANNNNGRQCCGALIRNMISMFDKCARNQQTDNLEQIACTEIRKANLANCNYMVYAMREETSPFNYNNQHKTCVKLTALESLEKARFVPKEKAVEIVNQVFDKCYIDLEPIGRRSVNKNDMKRAYYERYKYRYMIEN